MFVRLAMRVSVITLMRFVVTMRVTMRVGMVVVMIVIVRMRRVLRLLAVIMGVVVPVVMTAIRAVHMPVIVRMSIVIVLVVMLVTVVVAAVRAMHMPVIVMLAVLVDLAAVAVLLVRVASAVGASFRLERGLERGEFRTQTAQHVLEHMVGGKPKVPLAHLHRHMTIAKVIGGAREFGGPGAFHVHHLLLARHDFDDATVRTDKQVAAAKHVTAR